METPHMWNRLHEGFSKRLPEVAERQQAVEQCLNDEDLPGLIQLHSGHGAQAAVEEFLVDSVDGHSAAVEGTRQDSEAAVDTMNREVAALGQRLDDVERESSREDTSVAVSRLSQLGDTTVNNVRKASELLAEIADPPRSLGMREILSSVHGPDYVRRLSRERKDEEYRNIREKRIRNRQEKALDGARTLLGSSKLPNALDAVLGEGAAASTMRREAEAARECKGQLQRVLRSLESAVEEGDRQLVACRARKLELSRDLDLRKASLRKALEELLRAEAVFQDRNVEHEALRLQTKRLEGQIDSAMEELSIARDGFESADLACDNRLEKAETCEQEVRDKVNAAANRLVIEKAEPLQAAASNVQIAIKWLTCLAQEKALETSCLERDRDAKEKRLREVQMRLRSPLQDDMNQLQTECAHLRDQKQSLDSQIQRCRAAQQEIQAELDAAQEQMRSFTSLDWCGWAPSAPDAEVAEDTAQSAYQAMSLWGRVASSMPVPAIADSPASTGTNGLVSTGSSSASSWQQQEQEQQQQEQEQWQQQQQQQIVSARDVERILPGITELLQHLVKEELGAARARYQQAQADVMFRAPGGSQHEVGSDAGLSSSWIQEGDYESLASTSATQ